MIASEWQLWPCVVREAQLRHPGGERSHTCAAASLGRAIQGWGGRGGCPAGHGLYDSCGTLIRLRVARAETVAMG